MELTVANLMQFSVYDGSTRIAFIEAEPRVAWRAARAYVRGMAHAAGQSGPERIEQSCGTRGRVRVTRGNFSALPTLPAGGAP